MLFKNIHLYTLESEFPYDAAGLTERLELKLLRPCGQMEMRTSGWVSPFGKRSEVLVHAGNDCLLMAAGREDRLLPGPVVREALEEKLDELEARDGFRPKGKRRRELKEDIEHELMPRAFTRSQRTAAYVDKVGGWLLIDAASAPRAEEVTGLLRDCLGTVGARPVVDEPKLIARMTRWLLEGRINGNDGNFAGFELGEDCDLQDSQQAGAVIRCRGQDLGSEDIRAHAKGGKEVSAIALVWRERISFVLSGSGHLKRVKFLDVLQEQLDDMETESEAEALDAAFAITTLELRNLLKELQGILPLDDSAALVAEAA